MIQRRMTSVMGAVIFSLIAIAFAVRVVDEPTEAGAGRKTDDPVGAWKLSCTPPDGKPRECVVTVFRAGQELRGEYTADGTTRPAKKVVYQDGVLCLEVDGKFAGQSYALTYKGAPQGEALRGTVRFSFGWASGSFPFEGQRIEQEVASAR